MASKLQRAKAKKSILHIFKQQLLDMPHKRREAVLDAALRRRRSKNKP